MFSPNITITEPGFVYIYISNEEATPIDVFFDDFKVTQNMSEVMAGADYYPFGLPIPERELTREPYRYGYQGQFSEKDKETGFNFFDLRMYDARIGRWVSPDPYGQYASAYVGMGNMPNMGTDPGGGWAWNTFAIGFG
ncbi:MAG: RHS repeat-associated core domain-containing protein, partial [Cytophagales bacterium]